MGEDKVSRKELEARIEFLRLALSHLTSAVMIFAQMAKCKDEIPAADVDALNNYLAKIAENLGITRQEQKP